MGNYIRKQISLSQTDMYEIEKIIENDPDLHTNSDVFKFLLYDYLSHEERESELKKLHQKISRVDYEGKLTQEMLKVFLPLLVGEDNFNEKYLEIERKLKNKLRGVK